MTTVTVQCDKYRVAHPKPPNDPADVNGVWCVPLVAALNHRFATDAHVQACHRDGPARRWSKASYPLTVGSLWSDVDAPGHVASPEWIADTFGRIREWLSEHGGVCYQTRNGFRVVHAIPPITVSDAAGDAEWKAFHAGVVAYVATRYGVPIDAACCDVVREYRLPKVTRDGVAQPGALYYAGALHDVLPPDADLTWRGALPTPVYRAEPDRPAADIPVTEWSRLWALLAEPLSHYPAGQAPNRNAVGLALSHLAEAAGVDPDAWAADVGSVWPEYPPAVVRTWWQDGTSGYGVGTVYRALHAVARLGIIVPFDALRALLPGDVVEPDEIVELGAADCAALLDTATVDRFAAIKRADAVAYERAVAELRKTADATGRATIARFGVLVNARVKELAARRTPTAAREIIAFDSKAWVSDGAGGYHQPVKRSNLVPRLRNLGRDDLVARSEADTWAQVSVATELVRSFAQRSTARWVDPETVVTGCPLPDITPVFDADVDAWLRALFADGYPAASQWIAACTPEYADRWAAALVVVGRTSIGKSFFFWCMAQLWGATNYVPLAGVAAQFNGRAETCPVWVDDECVELRKGRLTSAQFLELMQRREHDIERKGQECTKAYGCARLGLPCNDLSQVQFSDALGPSAIEAMAGRFSVHVIPIGSERERAAVDALDRMRLASTGMVDSGRVLRHLRWVQCNTAVDPVGVTRFIGAWGGEHARGIALAGTLATHPAVYDALTTALAGPYPAWLVVNPDGVYVYPAGLAQALALTDRVTLRDVHAALKPICPEGGRRRTFRVAGAPVPVRAWRIDPQFAGQLLAAE